MSVVSKKLQRVFLKVKIFFVRNAPALSGAQVAVTTGVSTATAMAFATAGNIPLAVAVGTWAGFCVVSGGITITKASNARSR